MTSTHSSCRGLVVCCALVLLALPLLHAQSPLRSGPMVGHVDMRSASIFVQTLKPSQVTIRYTDSTSGKTYSTPVHRSTDDQGNCLTFHLDSVEPGRTYRYSVVVDGSEVRLAFPTVFRSRPIWKYRGKTIPNVTIALGSCHYVNELGYERLDSSGAEKGYGTPTEIFSSILARRPDAMLWLGDNVYMREPDWGSRGGMLKRYSHTRAHDGSRAMFASVPNYATWDDHDYGPNDSDRSWWMKNTALEVFKLFWPNPSYGLKGQEGICTSMEIGDVQVFMLDDRWFRNANDRIDQQRRILGDAQLQWLIDGLAASRATFKVVAVGSQVLSDNKKREGFERSSFERDEMIQAITKNKITGVVFASGDVHFAELSKLDREGTYPLYELTSSPLSAGLNTSQTYRMNTFNVPGTEYVGHNFGLISVEGARGARTLTLRIVDASGKDVWQQTVSEKDLR
ncbi:MAG TPA: phosphodiesterase [Bacteroidetes bacterium]|nr:phosphodiesterase [Bacteroidota bacterium]